MVAPRRVAWRPEALRELSDTVQYISADAPGSAEQVGRAIVERADSMAVFPERGRIVPEIGLPWVRETFVHRYRLMYAVLPDEVIVLAVFHGSRNFWSWLSQRAPRE